MLLQTEHVSKAFGGVYALRDVNLSLSAGEIRGLVGENGAGKSTLIKLLTGVYPLREGRILWDGQPADIASPEDSSRLGIRVIHQDRTLIPTFNGVENCYLGMEYPTRLGRVDWAAMERRVRQTMEPLGIALDLKKTAAELSPPQRTELEIVRARMTDCRLLILDEPTASLTEQEAGRLFRLLRQLKAQGTAILYVSHRLDEIFHLTDSVTVLRNGELVDTAPTADITRQELVAKMSRRSTAEPVQRRGDFGPPVLEVEGLASRDGRVKQGNLTVHSGEILGVFGLGGSGRTELLECIFGCRAAACGTVKLEGSPPVSADTGKRHPAGHGPHFRGSAGQGHDRESQRPGQYPPVQPRQLLPYGRPAAAPGRPGGGRADRRTAYQAGGAGAADGGAVRRQPAEGGICPRTDDRAQGSSVRRADAGGRRIYPHRDPPAAAGQDRRGRRGAVRFLRPAGTAGNGGPYSHRLLRPHGGMSGKSGAYGAAGACPLL